MTEANATAAEVPESAEIVKSLSRWAHHHYGVNADIRGLSRLPGHSGITYSFDVDYDSGRDCLVLRVPPIGVRHKNNLDVLRLAPALQLAAQSGVPVPAVRWHDSDESWFGTPYLMVERVEGATLPDIFDADAGPFPDRATVELLFRQAIDALTAIHRVNIEPLLESKWATVMAVHEDIDQWIPLLEKSENETEIRHTLELRKRLLETAPLDDTVALVHGDFYSNNWMFHDNRLTAILDWENTTLNRPMWDLGWLATLYDPHCWAASRSDTMNWHPSPETLFEWYEESAGSPARSPHWYQALMCYRLASITPSKVRLHRTGRRVDPIWEVFAEAIPHQLDRGFELLGAQS